MFGIRRVTWIVQWVLVAVLVGKLCALRFTSNTPGAAEILMSGKPANHKDFQVSCALSLTRSQLADSTHISILGQASWLDGFLRAANVSVTLLRRTDERVPVHNLISDVVFVVMDGAGNRTFVQEALDQVQRSNLYYARVVVWWESGDAQVAVDAAQDLETVRLVVVSGAGVVQQVYGYREECKNATKFSRATLLGECIERKLLLSQPDLFLDLLRWNFEGCPLPMLVTQYPPFRELRPRPKGGFSLHGIFAPLPHALAKRLNATLDAKNLRFTEEFGGFWSEKTIRRYDGREVTFSVIRRTAYLDGLAEMNPSFSVLHQSFFVPSGLGTEPRSFYMVHREFSPAVWVVAGMVYVVVFILVCFFWQGNHSVQDAAFFTLSTFFGDPSTSPIQSARFKTLSAFGLVFCIVLSTAYLAALKSLVTAPSQPPDINSLPELAKSGLTVVGTSGSIDLLKERAQDTGNTTLVELSARSQSVTQLEEAAHRIATTRDIAVYFETTTVISHFTRLEALIDRKVVHEIEGSRDSGSLVSYFVLRRGSPLHPVILDVMTQALDSGLLVRILNQLMFRRPEKKQHWFQLSLSNVSPVFKMLFVGLAFSTLIFTFEILSAHGS